MKSRHDGSKEAHITPGRLTRSATMISNEKEICKPAENWTSLFTLSNNNFWTMKLRCVAVERINSQGKVINKSSINLTPFFVYIG